MLYLLDTNVLIDANRDYYSIARVPEFWEWLEELGKQGRVKIPNEMFDEIKQGKKEDELTKWVNNGQVRDALLLDEEFDPILVQKAVHVGYANDLTDIEIEEIGYDPFLIADALADPKNRVVVTTEVSKPKKQRANRRVPDVCNAVGIQSCHTFQMIRKLDFSTNWREG
ncbi:DUF4411 family protein [Synechococcus sp. PCC 7336]|uniref:DUF4411 family protein n=1 Tax=Synechococcus sp. PCC 7336 TaxID=195250 RepID=UPI00047565BD|nr:DUF4411 family protein [Synechococcus sp. PCC 7336]